MAEGQRRRSATVVSAREFQANGTVACNDHTISTTEASSERPVGDDYDISSSSEPGYDPRAYDLEMPPADR